MSQQPMELTMPSDLDRAWAAGLFEGEGHIKHKPPIRLMLGSTDEDTILRFHNTVISGTLYGPYKTKGNFQVWTWVCTDHEHIINICHTFWRFLGQRRRSDIYQALPTLFPETKPPQRLRNDGLPDLPHFLNRSLSNASCP